MTKLLRRIDELGRIVLPLEVRAELGWGQRTPLEITLQEDKSVVIRAREPICALCGSGDELIAVDMRRVCKCCLEAALKNSVTGAIEDDAGDGGA